MQLLDGVYAFPLVLELDDRELTFHPGAVETGQGLLLVDAGYPGSVDQFDAHLEEAEFGWSDVWDVALAHRDAHHAGGLAEPVERDESASTARPSRWSGLVHGSRTDQTAYGRRFVHAHESSWDADTGPIPLRSSVENRRPC